MQKEYYEAYSKLEKSHWWFKARAKLLSKTLHAIHQSTAGECLKILNVGAATGQSTRMLEPFGTVSSLESDEDCCQYLRHVAGIEVVHGSATQLPFPDHTYDWVCAFDVIEHIEQDHKAIHEMARVLKPGGTIVLTVPAYSCLWSEHDVINQHFRRYTAKRLKALVKLYFDTKYSSYFNFILFPIIAIVRIYGRITSTRKTKSIKSDFDFYRSSKLLNKLFYTIFNAESRFIGKLSMPFGVSILYIGQSKTHN